MMALRLGEEQCCAAAAPPNPIESRKVSSVKAMQELSRWLFYLSKLTSHPLFSIFTASSLLILLYLPRPLIPLLLSPFPISSFLLLLRSGFKSDKHRHPPLPDHSKPEPEPKTHPEPLPAPQDLFFSHSGFEWAPMGGPLEVIYEGHEDDGDSPRSSLTGRLGVGSFGFCFTDSDSDLDPDYYGDGCEPSNLCFRWAVEEDDEEEEMIEIALEEDNLIEIDISGSQR